MPGYTDLVQVLAFNLFICVFVRMSLRCPSLELVYLEAPLFKALRKRLKHCLFLGDMYQTTLDLVGVNVAEMGRNATKTIYQLMEQVVGESSVRHMVVPLDELKDLLAEDHLFHSPESTLMISGYSFVTGGLVHFGYTLLFWTASSLAAKCIWYFAGEYLK